MTIISPVLIEISSSINTPIDEMGIPFAIFSFGLIIGAFSNSVLSKYRLRKKISLLSTLFLSISVFSVVFAPNLAFLSVSFFFMGICGGFIETTVSLIIIDANKINESFYLNITYAFIGLGAFIGPYLPIACINMGLSWRGAFLIFSFLCMICFILYLFVKVCEPVDAENNLFVKSLKRIRLDIKSFSVLMLFSAIFFYVCVETGINSWIPTYLRIYRGFTFSSAGNAISYFWLFLAAGRFLFGFISKRISNRIIILFLTIMSTITVTVAIYTDKTIVATVFIVISGFFLSSIINLILVIGAVSFPLYKNSLVPLLTMSGGTGGIFSPWLIGFLFKKYDLLLSINLIVIFSILLMFSVFIYLFLNKRRT